MAINVVDKKVFVVIGDREHVFKRGIDTLFQEPIVGIRLDFNEVGERQMSTDFREINTAIDASRIQIAIGIFVFGVRDEIIFLRH